MANGRAAFLGAWEVSPWEIATAYSIFSNNGTRFCPYLISEIKDHKGSVLYSAPPVQYPAAYYFLSVTLNVSRPIVNSGPETARGDGGPTRASGLDIGKHP